MEKVLNLKDVIKDNVEYSLFLRKTKLDNMSKYPFILYKEFFIGEQVMGLIKNKESKMYNKILKKLKESNISEIKID